MTIESLEQPAGSVVPPPGDRRMNPTSTANPSGYRMTHTMIRISDPEKSLNFYQSLLRMSLIFTLNTGPCIVYYLGYPDEGDHSPADILKGGMGTGLLELVHVPAKKIAQTECERAPISVQSLGHLGFKVPDVKALLEMAQEQGHTILKPVSHVPATVVGIHDGLDTETLHPSFANTYSQIGFIADPDGHCLEILPMKWA
ncbi:hypothetical protein FPOAC2_14474 [Fusarium poae]|uniref:VOC domain-containing protein n=1 Tax=Fusarium poae TaxID=36050 RepID=A0A1B8A686_FUSPO|nr:hypothetical protein FPOA_13269 [Fusarium poae]